MKEATRDDILEGTTRKVFRFIYRQGRPVGVHDIQRGLGLSSPSVAYYHANKLLKAGLLKEEENGYTVEKTVFENMIRIRGTVLPLRTGYVVFFLASLVILLTVIRPTQLSSTYVFSIAALTIAFGIAVFDVVMIVRKPY